MALVSRETFHITSHRNQAKAARHRERGHEASILRLLVPRAADRQDMHALEAQGLKRGIAALCIGGGEATAIAVERIVHKYS